MNGSLGVFVLTFNHLVNPNYKTINLCLILIFNPYLFLRTPALSYRDYKPDIMG